MKKPRKLTEEQLQHRRETQREYRKKNREHIRAYMRQWYQDHKEKWAEWGKRKYAKNREHHNAVVRKNYLDRTFGPGGSAHYDAMFTKQGGRCAICGQPPRKSKWGRLHQDHDTACCPYDRSQGRAETKMLRTCGKCRRGLLCNNCNAALAGIERPGWLRKALRYLRQWERKPNRNLAPIVDLMAKLKREMKSR